MFLTKNSITWFSYEKRFIQSDKLKWGHKLLRFPYLVFDHTTDCVPKYVRKLLSNFTPVYIYVVVIKSIMDGG